MAAAELTFLDSAGLAAAFSRNDPLRPRALPIWNRLARSRTPLLTTSLILIEVGDYFSKVAARPAALMIRELLTDSDRVEVVQVTPAHEAAAWNKFARFADKDWGLTDCVSFVIMEERDCRVAFTADRHFAQAGFTPLLGG